MADGAPPGRPPVARRVVAADHAGESLLVLCADEQERCTNTIDLALAFSTKADHEALAASLSRTLSLFPACAGRFVRRAVAVEGNPCPEERRCILCNNRGVSFAVLSIEGAMPPLLGALPQSLFDRAVGTKPGPDGALGGPLLRVRVLDFDDGQVLALSWAQGLTDAAGIGLLLRAWGRLYRGEDPGPPPTHERAALETALRGCGIPLADASFARLLRGPPDAEAAAAPRPPEPPAELVLVSFALSGEELAARGEALGTKCREQRFIYSSDTLAPDVVAFSAVLEALGSAVLASLRVDYRATFFVERHFGNAWGAVDLDLPRGRAAAAGALHQHPQAAQSRDFWAWKRLQPPTPDLSTLHLSSWLGTLGPLADLGFEQGGGPCGATLGAGFWQQWVDGHRPDCPSCVVVLPQCDGVQVMALVPEPAAERLGSRHSCHTWYPTRAGGEL